jgi:hypothetical protein
MQQLSLESFGCLEGSAEGVLGDSTDKMKMRSFFYMSMLCGPILPDILGVKCSSTVIRGISCAKQKILFITILELQRT